MSALSVRGGRTFHEFDRQNELPEGDTCFSRVSVALCQFEIEEKNLKKCVTPLLPKLTPLDSRYLIAAATTSDIEFHRFIKESHYER
jgi:hypothetical protein